MSKKVIVISTSMRNNANSDILADEFIKGAKRSNSTTRKCRCNKAKVLSITDENGEELNIKTAVSLFDEKFIYTIGETVEVKDFDECRWHECAPGIHFWIDRLEALNYNL